MFDNKCRVTLLKKKRSKKTPRNDGTGLVTSGISFGICVDLFVDNIEKKNRAIQTPSHRRCSLRVSVYVGVSAEVALSGHFNKQ